MLEGYVTFIGLIIFESECGDGHIVRFHHLNDNDETGCKRTLDVSKIYLRSPAIRFHVNTL